MIRILLIVLLALLAGCTCGVTDETAGSSHEVEIREGPCGVDDLVLFADVRANAGQEVPLTTRERLYLGVVIGNPCQVPIEFDSPKVCLVHEFVLTGGGRGARPGGPPCAEARREWAIEPAAGETMTFDLGTLAAGEYAVTVPFTFTERTTTARFVVLE